MSGKVISQVQIGSDKHLISSSLYGTCSTAAGTAAKEVKLADTNVNGFTVMTGMTLAVKFTYSNTSSTQPTLTLKTNGNVQLLSAKNIYKYGTTKPGVTEGDSWYAGSTVLFVYDGSAWQMAN